MPDSIAFSQPTLDVGGTCILIPEVATIGPITGRLLVGTEFTYFNVMVQYKGDQMALLEFPTAEDAMKGRAELGASVAKWIADMWAMMLVKRQFDA